eukprot:gene14828-5945_t
MLEVVDALQFNYKATNSGGRAPHGFQTKNISTVSTVPLTESETEARKIKEVLATAVSIPGSFYDIMHRLRFKNICLADNKMDCPLTTEEFNAANEIWIKRVQGEATKVPVFEQQMHQLNLKENDKGIYVCAGRLKGDYPFYLTTDAVCTERLVINEPLNTLHGGVGLTITKIRERYWVPRSRQLTKD